MPTTSSKSPPNPTQHFFTCRQTHFWLGFEPSTRIGWEIWGDKLLSFFFFFCSHPQFLTPSYTLPLLLLLLLLPLRTNSWTSQETFCFCILTPDFVLLLFFGGKMYRTGLLLSVKLLQWQFHFWAIDSSVANGFQATELKHTHTLIMFHVNEYWGFIPQK